jgi:hypothetical protein
MKKRKQYPNLDIYYNNWGQYGDFTNFNTVLSKCKEDLDIGFSPIAHYSMASRAFISKILDPSLYCPIVGHKLQDLMINYIRKTQL